MVIRTAQVINFINYFDSCDGTIECARFEDECNASCPYPLHPACDQFSLKLLSFPRSLNGDNGIEVMARQCRCQNKLGVIV